MIMLEPSAENPLNLDAFSCYLSDPGRFDSQTQKTLSGNCNISGVSFMPVLMSADEQLAERLRTSSGSSNSHSHSNRNNNRSSHNGLGTVGLGGVPPPATGILQLGGAFRAPMAPTAAAQAFAGPANLTSPPYFAQSGFAGAELQRTWPQGSESDTVMMASSPPDTAANAVVANDNNSSMYISPLRPSRSDMSSAVKESSCEGAVAHAGNLFDNRISSGGRKILSHPQSDGIERGRGHNPHDLGSPIVPDFALSHRSIYINTPNGPKSVGRGSKKGSKSVGCGAATDAAGLNNENSPSPQINAYNSPLKACAPRRSSEKLDGYHKKRSRAEVLNCGEGEYGTHDGAWGTSGTSGILGSSSWRSASHGNTGGLGGASGAARRGGYDSGGSSPDRMMHYLDYRLNPPDSRSDLHHHHHHHHQQQQQQQQQQPQQEQEQEYEEFGSHSSTPTYRQPAIGSNSNSSSSSGNSSSSSYAGANFNMMVADDLSNLSITARGSSTGYSSGSGGAGSGTADDGSSHRATLSSFGGTGVAAAYSSASGASGGYGECMRDRAVLPSRQG